VQSWQVSRELVSQTAALDSSSRSSFQLRDGGTVTYRHEYTARVAAANPAGAVIEVRSEVEVDRASGKVLVQTVSVFTANTVVIHAEIKQDAATCYCRDWSAARTAPGPK
jgi:hypothetical protein